MFMVNSSTDLNEEFRSGLGGVAVGDYDLIKDPKEVASYVTKYFGVYDIDYDFLLKEDRTHDFHTNTTKSFPRAELELLSMGNQQSIFFSFIRTNSMFYSPIDIKYFHKLGHN